MNQMRWPTERAYLGAPVGVGIATPSGTVFGHQVGQASFSQREGSD
jgi:hypothetical protein